MSVKKQNREEIGRLERCNARSGQPAGRVVLVTGGCRSGKSAFAEGILRAMPGPLMYIATAMVDDSGMAQRVKAHRDRRGCVWTTLEEPEYPDRLLQELAASHTDVGGVLLDCVTVWMSNCMAQGQSDAEIRRRAGLIGETARELSALRQCPVVLVTNEVGCGIAPVTELGNRFRDLAGLVNQDLARCADDVVLVACGLPLVLKGELRIGF